MKEKFGLVEISFRFFCVYLLLLGMALHFLFQYFGTAPSCRLHCKRFLSYVPGRYSQYECVSQCICSNMHDTLIASLLQVSKNMLSLNDLYEL